MYVLSLRNKNERWKGGEWKRINVIMLIFGETHMAMHFGEYKRARFYTILA